MALSAVSQEAPGQPTSRPGALILAQNHPYGDKLMRGLHRAVAGLAQSGPDVIVDYIRSETTARDEHIFSLADIEDGHCPQCVLASLLWKTRVTPARTSLHCLTTPTSGPGIGLLGSPTTNTSGSRCPAAARSDEQSPVTIVLMMRTGPVTLDMLQELPAASWWEPLGPIAHEYAESSKVALVLHNLDEQIHHGAELGVMRDLYQHHRAKPARSADHGSPLM